MKYGKLYCVAFQKPGGPASFDNQTQYWSTVTLPVGEDGRFS
ncbi:MAG: hypothetical protein ACYDGS_06560 [Thermoleophilia bacterium]